MPAGGSPQAAHEHEWLRVTLSSIGDAVIVTDPGGVITFMNAVAVGLTGWEPQDAAGQPVEQVFRILNEDTRQTVESPVRRVLREGVVVGLANHTVLVAKNGREVPIDDSGAPIRGESGAIAGVVLVFRDVTEARRAVEARLHLAAIVESSDDAIISKNLDGIITSWNRGAERLYGYTGEEAVGRPLSMLVPTDLRDELPAIMERIQRGERVEHFETVRVCKDGSRVDVSLTISPVKNAAGKIVGASKIARDVTTRNRAAEDLRTQEQRFWTLTRNAPVGIFQTDAEGNCLFVNERWCDLAGLSPEAAAGPGWAAALHPDDRERVFQEWYGAAEAGREFASEYRFRTPHGKVSWLQGSAVALRNETGDVTGYIGTITDIGGTKRAQEALHFLADASATLAALVDYESTLQKVAALTVPRIADWCAVDMVEPDGSMRRLAVAHADPAKVRLAQDLQRRYPPDPSSPHGVPQVLRTGQPDMMADIPDELIVQGARDEEHLRLLRELGLKSYMCVPLKGRGKLLGVVSFVSAESGQRYTNTDLSFAEELARRAATAIENAKLYAELREADRRKDEFLAMLAHELRNPLAPIRNALHIMQQPGADAAVGQQLRDMAKRQVQHLARLLDDLLDVSRISRGKIELRREPVDVAVLVNRSAEAVRPLYEERHHQLTVSLPLEPLRVEGDPTRLEQVLTNLLNNAAKYTDPGGKVWLTAERADGEAVIRVRDTGIGIEPVMLPRIFDLFVQADRRLERSQAGLGIGLTLVKKLVELHGGRVEVSSPGPAKGSEFVVRLPTLSEPPPTNAVQAAAGEDATLPRRRVVVADDNRDAADSLAMLLRLAGQNVRLAYDGPSALAEARAFRPDVVFLDIGMPGMDGYEVAMRLREVPELESTVVVAVTGWGQAEDRRRSLEAGFDGHMVKPAEPSALRQFFAHPKLARRTT
jgi:PAS domain S-box-containing protein